MYLSGDIKISKKKNFYPVSENLKKYLQNYDRFSENIVNYDDLLRFSNSISLFDNNDNDTLWVSVMYSDSEFEEIQQGLIRTYVLLKSDGNEEIMKNLKVARIDYCTFGNSNPFRVKILNILNDNYDYIYVKTPDASRVYGLELEQLTSPNTINFIINDSVLVEEHIMGIPGDIFIDKYLELEKDGHVRLAKEFVKFNERCFIRLLGDMRSYNYVVTMTHDIDKNQYRIRAIDFDQQSYNGRKNVYKPQFFKENKKMVKLVIEKLQSKAVEQYQNEERVLISKRIKSQMSRINDMVDTMETDTISTKENVLQLRMELFEYTKDIRFKKCNSMGEILRVALRIVMKIY